jgi:hypothetical protein
MMKNTNHARVVQELADLFYRSESLDDPATLVGMAYEKLQQVIFYPQAGYFNFDPRSMELKPVWESGTPNQITCDYLSYYHQFDPFVMELPCLKSPNRAVRFSDFTDIKTAYGTEMADMLLRADYHHCIATVPHTKGMPTAVVSLRRSKREADFDREETRLFEWFSNHLVLGLERHALMRKLYPPPRICCFAIPMARFCWRAMALLLGSIDYRANKSYRCRARRHRDDLSMRLGNAG